MMKVVHVDEQAQCTMLYLERDDGQLVAHALPIGLLESRVGEWDLPDDVDPLDVVLVETHLTDIDPSPYDGDFEESRAALLAEVKKHRGKIEWGKETKSNETTLSVVLVKKPALSKDHVKGRCLLPGPIGDDVREEARARRKEHRENKAAEMSPAQQRAEMVRNRGMAAAAHKRFAEERLADDIVGAMPERLRRAPKGRESPENNGAAVGFAIKLVP